VGGEGGGKSKQRCPDNQMVRKIGAQSCVLRRLAYCSPGTLSKSSNLKNGEEEEGLFVNQELRGRRGDSRDLGTRSRNLRHRLCTEKQLSTVHSGQERRWKTVLAFPKGRNGERGKERDTYLKTFGLKKTQRWGGKDLGSHRKQKVRASLR